jgi:hypothetical protein
MARTKPDENRDWWFDKPNTQFGQDAIRGIPAWIESIESSRITAHPSYQAEYAKIDGKTFLRWYFAPDYITFFLSEDVSSMETERLRSKLSDPFWRARAKYGGPAFHAQNERDLRAVKEFILDRLEIPDDERSRLFTERPGDLDPSPLASNENQRSESQGTGEVQPASQDNSVQMNNPAINDGNSQDERQRKVAEIILRPKQAEFRKRLIDAYEGRCAITRCSAPLALQAAHIVPVNENGTDSVRNGILLRADLHLLFDAGLITINHDGWTVEIAPMLAGTGYETLAGNTVRVPDDEAKQPSAFSLNMHRVHSKRSWSN